MPTGNPGKPRARGKFSSRAKGIARVKEAVEAKHRILKELGALQDAGQPIPAKFKLQIDDEVMRKKALELLAGHNIKPAPALVDTAMDYYRAAEVFTFLSRQLEITVSPNDCARLGQSLAAQLKLRRNALADLGLPGDPDEREDLIGMNRKKPVSEAATKPTSVQRAEGTSDLDEFLKDD